MSELVDGPAGALELLVDGAETRSSAVAVLCHPHPQYGGSAHDAVLGAAVEALRARQAVCVRFNFRGVGRSEGHFDDGHGERDDVLAVVRHVRARFGPKPLLLLGYSFGALMAWRAAAEAAPDALFLIAPPVGHAPLDVAEAPPCTVHIVAGALDEYAPEAALRALHGALPAPGVLTIVPGADHVFGGCVDEVGRALLEAS
ncbi:MAG: alpha/beta fold hydrolase [Pseudomonadales bacterium]|nr:alpha/beta fold hydrolase [Pseudomonadales bacterium]